MQYILLYNILFFIINIANAVCIMFLYNNDFSIKILHLKKTPQHDDNLSPPLIIFFFE